MDDSKPVDIASSFDVLSAEYRTIWPGEPDPETPEDYYRRVHERSQAALCLSGGGVRSAAFSLGVIQVLSVARLLTSFHYLSTVSGGGYLGGWLQRWIHARQGNADKVMDALADLTEPDEVTALRPDPGFGHGDVGRGGGVSDSWHNATAYLRNFIVTWLLLAPLLILVALAPSLALAGIEALSQPLMRSGNVIIGYQIAATLAIALALYSTGRALPSYRLEDQKQSPLRLRLNETIIFPMILWSLIGTMFIAAASLQATSKYQKFDVGPHLMAYTIPTGAALALLALIIRLRGAARWALVVDLPAWTLALLTATGAAWGGAYVLINAPPDPFAFVAGLLGWFSSLLGLPAATAEQFRAAGSGGLVSPMAALVVLGPVVLIASQLLGNIIFVAFRRRNPGGKGSDADREWLNRLAALKVRLLLVWVFVGFSTLLVRIGMPNLDVGTLFIVAAVSGTFVALSPAGRDHQPSLTGILQLLTKVVPLMMVTTFAAVVFLATTLLIAAELGDKIVVILEKAGAPYLPSWVDLTPTAHFALLFVLILFLTIASRRIPVNRFSLTGLHRVRLARLFLGSARANRAPDHFTGIDPDDNLPLAALQPLRRGTGHTVLYPILNASLDLTVNQRRDERTSQSFILSPMYSGSGILNQQAGAYARSDSYAADESGRVTGGSGISLATAMAISGAAASPRIDTVSSSVRNMVLTLLCLRLGAWLPNPARAAALRGSIIHPGSSNALRATLREVGGSIDENGLEVRLSDGGQFDNLGLYEMIRRRCRYIVVCDAGLDPDLTFADLGNVIRKVKIDFGVEIRADLRRPNTDGAKPKTQFSWQRCQIDYPEGTRGEILYLKASLEGGGLPVETASYAATSKAFPHETTADSAITEAQFESYRRLGVGVMVSAFPMAQLDGVAQLFDATSMIAESGTGILDRMTPASRSGAVGPKGGG